VASETIAVLGAGHMGQSALRILLRHHPHDGFRVFDHDERALVGASSLDPQRVRTRQSDLLNDDLDLSGCAVLLNLAAPFFTGSDRAARAAPAHGVPYLDIADDAETTQAILDLDGEASRQGVPLLMARGTGLGAADVVDVLLSNGAPAGAHGVEVLDHAQALDTFIALAEDEYAFSDGIIAASAAAAAGGAR
jgi:lysine 6-dehydrogenase